MATTTPLAAVNQKMTSFRWTICLLLFLATTVNYMDRQVLSLTWKEFISPEFHWTDANYGLITAVFSIVYAVANLLAGRFIDWMGTKKGYLWAIGVWSAGACLHAVCGIATEGYLGLDSAAGLVQATGDIAVTIATVSFTSSLSHVLSSLLVRRATSLPPSRLPPNISRSATVRLQPPFSMPALLWAR